MRRADPDYSIRIYKFKSNQERIITSNGYSLIYIVSGIFSSYWHEQYQFQLESKLAESDTVLLDNASVLLKNLTTFDNSVIYQVTKL